MRCRERFQVVRARLHSMLLYRVCAPPALVFHIVNREPAFGVAFAHGLIQPFLSIHHHNPTTPAVTTQAALWIVHFPISWYAAARIFSTARLAALSTISSICPSLSGIVCRRSGPLYSCEVIIYLISFGYLRLMWQQPTTLSVRCLQWRSIRSALTSG